MPYRYIFCRLSSLHIMLYIHALVQNSNVVLKTESVKRCPQGLNVLLPFFVSFRKKSMDPTYYTSQGIIAGSSQAFTTIEGRSTPTGLESACTVSGREK